MTNNRVILVTGASSGIGKETAKTLIQEGYTVYGAARHVTKMADLERMGGYALEMDVTEEADMVAAVERIQTKEGGVDILINVAGFGLYGPVEEIPLAKARYQFEVNLFGMARLTQLVLPTMRQKGAGMIVNVSSMGGKIYTPLGAWYHASKHAVEGWSDCLRFELAPFNIDVVIIEPGFIDTGFYQQLDDLGQQAMGGPYEELAQAVASAAGSGAPLSPPSVVADTILRAIKARRPKTRYATGAMARPLILMRKWLGDRLFDWVTRQVLARVA
jgi:NAD(P)-dependent dehydrogenase (short-subunit alcohol dehydrogenase family)